MKKTNIDVLFIKTIKSVLKGKICAPNGVAFPLHQGSLIPIYAKRRLNKSELTEDTTIVEYPMRRVCVSVDRFCRNLR